MFERHAETAFATGAASGIGLATCRVFAKQTPGHGRGSLWSPWNQRCLIRSAERRSQVQRNRKHDP